jgi:hypothetical protein
VRRSSLVAALALVACAPDLDPPSRITKLRLLAVQAEPAWAHPGEQVQLTGVAVDPQLRPLSWAYATCVDPAGTGVQDCVGALPSPPAWTLAGAMFALQVPADAIDRLAPDGRAGASVGVVVVVCPGDIAAGDTAGVPVACVAGGRQLGLDEFEVGVKRVFVREQDRNANPTIDAIDWDGADWPAGAAPLVDACATSGGRFDQCTDDGKKHTVAAHGGTAESGVDELGAPFAERLVVEYYATEGTFKDDARIEAQPETTWFARDQSRGRTVTMFAVLRDDRGGVSWATRSVTVQQ